MESAANDDRVIDFRVHADRIRQRRLRDAQARRERDEAERQREIEEWQRLLLREFRL